MTVATHAEAVTVFLGPWIVDVMVGQTVCRQRRQSQVQGQLTTLTVVVWTG